MASLFVCVECGVRISSFKHRISCCKCSRLTHRVCMPLPERKKFGELINSSYLCKLCVTSDSNSVDNSFIHDFLNASYEYEPERTPHPTSYRVMQGSHDLGLPRDVNALSIAHVNLCSIRNKFSDLADFLGKNKLHIFACTESKLDSIDRTSNYDIANYETVRLDNDFTGKGGGLLLYFFHSVIYRNMNFDIKAPGRTEYAVFHIKLSNSSPPFLLILIYNNPKTKKKDFLEFLVQLLLAADSTDLNCILLGDLNFDLLKTQDLAAKYCKEIDSDSSELLNILRSFNFELQIKVPTRITTTTETCLDPIFTKLPYKVLRVDSVPFSSTDHNLVFINIDYDKKSTRLLPRIIESRCFKKVDWKALQFKLFPFFNWPIGYIDWEQLVHQVDNVIKLDSDFILDKIESALYKALLLIPKNKIRVKGSVAKWFDSDIKALVRAKALAKQKFQKSREVSDHVAYKKINADVKVSVNRAKNTYFLHKFDKMRESSDFWNTCHELIGTKKSKQNSIKSLEVNGSITDNQDLIFDSLARAFELPPNAGVGELINDKLDIPRLSKDICVDSNDLSYAIFKTKAKHKNDPCVKILLGLYPVFSILLTLLMNIILKSGKIPDRLKKAFVVPIYKGKGQRTLADNFRPISLLPFISKLLERIIASRIRNLTLDQLDNNQHGFRNGYSCDTALTEFTNYLYTSLDNPSYMVGVVFVDLKKAFNSVDHEKLLLKLRTRFGLPWWLYRLLRDYFLNRTFIIGLGKLYSKIYPILRGVPQGSVLGPLLFILFITDIKVALSLVLYTLYADDLCFYIGGNNIEEIENKLNMTLQKLSLWFDDNDLILSIDKTKAMLIRKPGLKIKKELQLAYRGSPIENVAKFKYLGIWIDINMNFNEHLNKVTKKLTSTVSLVTRIKRQLSKRTLSILLKAFIHPVCDFGLTIWGRHADATYQLLQNKVNNILLTYEYPKFKNLFRKGLWATRNVVTNDLLAKLRKAKSNISIDSLLYSYNLLTIKERLAYFTLIRLYKILKFNTANLKRLFHFSTRNSVVLIVPMHRTVFAEDSFVYRAVKLWNSLPTDIRRLDFVNCDEFNEAISCWLLEKRSGIYVP
jgi:hypothetical protein